ncbi:hypothetical protein K439DRAFT_1634090 [Ramaria rubella]|nr:hypothetical protein K439DRAFT_1634090 [Ramaria rubella]
MTEALGLASSVIAVLQLSSAILKSCSNYHSGVKNASRDQKNITEQLIGWETTLRRLVQLLLQEDASSRLPALGEVLSQPYTPNETDGRLARCRAELEGLRKKLEPQRGRKGIVIKC